MKRNVFLILGIVVLSVLGSNVFADTVDVVYLKNGSIIRGMVVETIPNETVKIRTSDGSIFVYSLDEVEKITKEIGKSFTTKLKNPYIATGIQMTTGIILSGGGQIYNGQYLKALGFGSMHFFIFHSSHIASAGIAVEVDDSLGNILIGMTYVFATLDAYLSAKSINKKRKGAITTSLRYIPNQGLVASYNMRF
jgi:hypothetical protein